MAKILLLGGTGAIGVYLIPELLNLGHEVFVTSRIIRNSNNDKLTYIHGDAKNKTFIMEVIADKYDAIIDFMVYTTDEFLSIYDILLSNTVHYIFLSTYKVFADSIEPITEKSPRLLDVSTDFDYLSSNDSTLCKAKQENILKYSKYSNWTIVRPTITYSQSRFQLVTLETDTIIIRAFCKCPVLLPDDVLKKYTTMTWGGDVAKMISMLVLNSKALCEDFNVCTSEHHTWEEVAEYYNKIINLKIISTNLETYLNIHGGYYQLMYDRMFNRIMDNSKILSTINYKNTNLTPLFYGLSSELRYFKNIYKCIKPNININALMDRITNSNISLKNTSLNEKIKYYLIRYNDHFIIIFLKKLNKYLIIIKRKIIK